MQDNELFIRCLPGPMYPSTGSMEDRFCLIESGKGGWAIPFYGHLLLFLRIPNVLDTNEGVFEVETGSGIARAPEGLRYVPLKRV